MRGHLIAGITILCGLMTALFIGHTITNAWAHGWQAPKKDAAIANPIADGEASIQRGREVFRKSCMICHGPKGLGDGLAARSLDPKPADLTMRIKMHSDGDFYWKIMNGRLPMPGFAGQLTPAEVWDTINYIKSLNQPSK